MSVDKIRNTTLLIVLIYLIFGLFSTIKATEFAKYPDELLSPGSARVGVSVYSLCHTPTSKYRNVSYRKRKLTFAKYKIEGNHKGICHNPNATRKYDTGCEVDHVISIGIGGDNTLNNLAIMPYFGSCNAHHKDRLESKIRTLVCSGKMSLKTGQLILSKDWQSGYSKYVNKEGCSNAE